MDLPRGSEKKLSILVCAVCPQQEAREAVANRAAPEIHEIEETVVRFLTEESVRGSAKRWAPGCVNAAGKARQKW